MESLGIAHRPYLYGEKRYQAKKLYDTTEERTERLKLYEFRANHNPILDLFTGLPAPPDPINN